MITCGVCYCARMCSRSWLGQHSRLLCPGSGQPSGCPSTTGPARSGSHQHLGIAARSFPSSRPVLDIAAWARSFGHHGTGRQRRRQQRNIVCMSCILHTRSSCIHVECTFHAAHSTMKCARSQRFAVAGQQAVRTAGRALRPVRSTPRHCADRSGVRMLLKGASMAPQRGASSPSGPPRAEHLR